MSRSLLTFGNPKTSKGTARGYLTAALHLAPHTLSGRNVCPWASPGCSAACLNTAGRGGIFRAGETTNAIQRARIARTEAFFADRAGFLQRLRHDIRGAQRKASRLGLTLTVRLNATSDIPWERVDRALFAEFPDVQFYDYTKAAHRVADHAAGRLPVNYDLTFSRSETNAADVGAFLGKARIAAVFAGDLPATWCGVPVVDGDETDLRFLDPRGVVVGLSTKGRARKDASGFVIATDDAARGGAS